MVDVLDSPVVAPVAPEPRPVDPMESDLTLQEREDIRGLAQAVQHSITGLRCEMRAMVAELQNTRETTKLNQLAIVTALAKVTNKPDCLFGDRCPASKTFQACIWKWLQAHKAELAIVAAGVAVVLMVVAGPGHAAEPKKTQPVERVLALPRAEPLEVEHREP